MLSQEQAQKLKVFLWAELPIEIVQKLPNDIIGEINKTIDKAIYAEKEELIA